MVRVKRTATFMAQLVRLSVSSIFSVAIKSTQMLFDRLLSLMGGINRRGRLEWSKGLKETEEGEKPGVGWTWAIY